MYSDELVLDENGLPVKLLDENGEPIKDENGRFVYQYELNDKLYFRATLRPEEETRAQVTVYWSSVDPVTGDRTGTASQKLHLDAETHTWSFQVSSLPEGETDFLFVVEVTAADGQVTKKEYRVATWRDATDDESNVPTLADKTTLKVSETGGTKLFEVNPTFEKETNFYYVNVPTETTEVNVSAVTGTYYKLYPALANTTVTDTATGNMFVYDENGRKYVTDANGKKYGETGYLLLQCDRAL